MREIWKDALLLGVLVVGFQTAQAQTAAESAVTASASRMSAQAAKAPTFTLASPAKQNGLPPSSAKRTSSPHLLERNGPPPDEVNRREFEENAGDRGGKLLLRSVPSGADIFINDLLVGRTPLMMVIAPGPYKIEMRGTRGDSGHANVGVMPKETRTVEINLKQRYPSSVSMR
jgi:PEGA domain-containing protein